MKRTRQGQKQNNDIVVAYDENTEGLAGKGVFEKIGVTQETSTKESNLKGQADSRIIQNLKNKYKKIIFITSDSEKEKKKEDFAPSENVGIIKIGGRTSQLKLDKKEKILKKLTKEGLKNKKSYLGRKIFVSVSGFKQTFYKTEYSTKFKKWKTQL